MKPKNINSTRTVLIFEANLRGGGKGCLIYSTCFTVVYCRYCYVPCLCPELPRHFVTSLVKKNKQLKNVELIPAWERDSSCEKIQTRYAGLRKKFQAITSIYFNVF